MGKRKDLTERERYAIEAYRNEKRSIKEIAVLLGRHYQTIYREIKRGTVEMLDSELRTYSKYCADTGQAAIAKATAAITEATERLFLLFII